MKMKKKYTAMAEKIKKLRASHEQRHLEGAGGFEICKSWTQAVDGLISELFLSFPENGEAQGAPFALAALGGYGRGELNPYSDIDLLFVYENGGYEDGTKSFKSSSATRIIPALWDIGFKVGHSTRTIADCLQMAGQDITIKTSMMEARFLLGNREFFNRFDRRYRNKVSKNVDSYLRKKIEEAKSRHERFHNTLLLTEPNIKESRGGLRDYHVALWTATARYGIKALSRFEERGLVDFEGAAKVWAAVDHLLRIRNDLHFATEAPHDTLTYALQPKVAKRLGYTGEGDEPATQMMHEYYRAADTVYMFGKSIMEQALRYRPKLPDFISRFRHRELAPNVYAGPQEIYLKGISGNELARKPERLFETLRLLAETELRPSPGLRKALETVGRAWKKEKPDQAVLSQGLMAILKTEDTADALRLMRDYKILTTVIPEFMAIRFLTPFDLYHKFTVDSHTFRAIREFDNLRRTEDEECDLLREFHEEEERRDLIRLTLLLHDVGKGREDKNDTEIDPAILQRMGCAEDETAVVIKLINIHLLMSMVSQRRDMHDEKTISYFCDQVGDAKTLKRLYMLTYADMRAVGPEVWNSWKGMLLKELYLIADARLEGKGPLKKIAPRHLLPKEKLTEKTQAFLNGMPNRYFVKRWPEEVGKDASLFAKFLENPEESVTQHRTFGEKEPGELIVIAKNRLGLLYGVVGTLTSKNVDILGSHIFTHRDDVAVDIFRIHGPDGMPITDNEFLSRIENEISRVIAGEKSAEDLMRGRGKLAMPQDDVPYIKTRIKILNDVSFDHTVIEITMRDRRGILYEMTRAFKTLRVNIVSALISTEGHKCVNIFYVTGNDGEKITSTDRINEIKTELKNAL